MSDELIRSYFAKYGFCRHQLEGFDRFVHVILPAILHENTKVHLQTTSGAFHHAVWSSDVTMETPTHAEANGCVFRISPHEARLRKLTYSLKIICKLHHRETHFVDVVAADSLRGHDSMRPVAVRCLQIDWPAKSMRFKNFELRFDCEETPTTHSGPSIVYGRMHDGVLWVLSFLPDSDERQVEVNRIENEHLASFMIPCMVGSSLCTLSSDGFNRNECVKDMGGYFIVNGHEKTLVAQQKLCINRIYVFSSRKSIFAEIRSCHRTKWRSTSTLQLLVKKGKVVAHVPFVNKSSSTALDIPFDILVSALTEESAADWIKQHSCSGSCPTSTEVLPHLGLDDDPVTVHKKKVFLGNMRQRLLNVVDGSCECDDRDDQANKRVDGAGPSLGILFRQIFRATMKGIRQLLRRLVDSKERYVNFSSALNFSKLTSAIRYHFATGNWSLSKGINMGVVQLLSGTSSTSRRSHLNRINVPINRDGKATKPRLLHKSSFGILCPSESPEGSSCGLMNNKALLCHVSTGMTTDMRENILEVLKVRCGLLPFEGSNALVLLCGDIIGRAPISALEMADTIRSLKLKGTLPFDMGVAVVDDEVHLMLQPGRCVRPLARVPKDQMEVDWDTCVLSGQIEYLDKLEEKFLKRSGMFEGRYDEVLEYGFLGEAVASIPFSNRNQAPRNMYQASMAKQAIGWPSLAVKQLYEAQTYVLHTPQRPLIRTEFDRVTNDVPNTISCVVAIATYGGYNQEDSVIVNRAAIERGLGTVSYLTSKTCSLNRHGRDMETFGKPVDCDGRTFGSRTDLLQDDGFPCVGSVVRDGDVIIGKIARTSLLQKESRSVCRSVVYDGGPSRVDAVMRCHDGRGNGSATVRLRRVMPLRVGDKISSRHGQKGTIGCVYNQEDMPFNPATGICPDIILNPHCIPSRMTIAQLLEMLCGKLAATGGGVVDGTPFRPLKVEEISARLRSCGYEPKGNEVLYSGQTGKPLECRVFMGVCAYQRLKHIASMKIHSRGATGPVSVLTRQPLEGRSRRGGLRFGEMERDTLLSHGTGSFMLDRLMYCSDPHEVAICTDCGHITDTDEGCTFCGGGSAGTKVTMPYSFLLLNRELQALGISTRIRLRRQGQGPIPPTVPLRPRKYRNRRRRVDPPTKHPGSPPGCRRKR